MAVRIAVSLALFVAGFASAQVEPDKSAPTFRVEDPKLGWQLWASEPLFANPTSMDVDHLGRVWICEAVNYRQSLHGKPILRPEGDRILILEDSTGHGKADKVTVFAQMPSIRAPLGVCVAKDPIGPGWKVYVCQSPDILVFEDRDGDGKADGPPRKLLTGFKGIDHDHGVHGITIGPDGRLYFSVGDQGVDQLQSSDGQGPKWTSNSTNCRAGTIWRCDLDGKNLELIAHNFRNQYKPCVDSFGNIFVSDNDDDGNQQTRICYVMNGGNYGYHPRGRGESHWHEESPGVVPKVLRTFFGSPTGMCFYEGTLLPESYRGQLLHCDAGPRHVRRYAIKSRGAGFELDRIDLVTSTDNWFRPSDVAVAPDGSVFVCDWYDPGVGGHGMGDTKRGRVYRLATQNSSYLVPKVNLDSDAGLLTALGSPANSARAMAIQALAQMPAEAADRVLQQGVNQTASPWLRARATWQLAKLGRPMPPLSADLKNDAESLLVRIRAFPDATRKELQNSSSELRQAVLSAPAQVQREAMLLIRDASGPAVQSFIEDMIGKYDGSDRFFLAALSIAVGGSPERRAELLAGFDRLNPVWNERVADLVWELRPPAKVAELESRLLDSSLPASQARMVDVVANNLSASAGLVLTKALSRNQNEAIRERLVANLKQNLPGKWAAVGESEEFQRTIDAMMERPDSAVLALELIAASGKTNGVDRIRRFLANQPAPQVYQASIRTLGAIRTSTSLDLLNEQLHKANAQYRPTIVTAIGQHLEENRRNSSGSNKPALELLQKVGRNADGKYDRQVQMAALASLAASRSGTQWLLSAKQEMPSELMPEIGRLVRNTPFQDLRNRAMIEFPPPGRLDPQKISIAALAKRTGDASRGKAILTASLSNELQCLKCHSVQGVGGQVGPDLSMIGKKASRENLYESILYPSKAVSDQFAQWTVLTDSGVTVSGLLIDETNEHTTLRDANGKDIRILRKSIDSKEKSTVSLMPEKLVNTLTEDDLVNLVEYLMTLVKPTVTPTTWAVLGPFPNDGSDSGLDRDFGPESDRDLKATYTGAKGPIRWRSISANSQGYFDLAAFHGSESNLSTTYLTRAIDAPAATSAKVLIGTDDGAKLWVNGELVYSTREHRAASPAKDAVEVKLKPGRNTLLLKIVNGNDPHGFYLSVQSDSELQVVKEENPR